MAILFIFYTILLCLPLVNTFQVPQQFSVRSIRAPKRTGSFLSDSPSSSSAKDSSLTDSQQVSDVVTGSIASLTSLRQFLDCIDDAPTDSLVVIQFHANSCQLCKRVRLRYQKIARFYREAPVQLTKVEKAIHPELFSTLNIPTNPFIQVYRNGQCVASHGIASEQVFEPLLHDTIQRELDMSEEDWKSFLTAFADPIQRSTEKLAQLRAILESEGLNE